MSKNRNIADLGSNDVLETTASGVAVDGNITLGDNDKAIFGAGSDLQIYHDGTNSWIRDLGTGSLVIDTDGTQVLIKGNGPTSTMAAFTKGGSSAFYHNNALKLATTTTGIDVTGTASMDALTVNGGGTQDGITASSASAVSDLTIGSLTTGADLKISYNRANGQTTISEGTRGSEVAIQKWYPNGNWSLYEDTGAVEKLFWNASTERLGIGTASPVEKLHVNGTTVVQGEIRSEKTTIGSDAAVYPRITGANYLGAEEPVSIIGANIDASLNRVMIGGGSSTHNSATSVDVYAAANTTTLSGTQIARFNTTGLGIGTTSPADKLDISNGGIRLNGGGLRLLDTGPANVHSMQPYVITYNDAYQVQQRTSSNAYVGQLFQTNFNAAGATNHNFYVQTAKKVVIDADGIKFNGDTAGANALDDYEEGTWGLNVQNYVNLTGTPTLSEARYTKVGNVVTYTGSISGLNATTTGVRTAIILRLPFSAATSTAPMGGSSYWGSGLDRNGIVAANTSSNAVDVYIGLNGNEVTSANAMTIHFVVTYITA